MVPINQPGDQPGFCKHDPVTWQALCYTITHLFFSSCHPRAVRQMQGTSGNWAITSEILCSNNGLVVQPNNRALHKSDHTLYWWGLPAEKSLFANSIFPRGSYKREHRKGDERSIDCLGPGWEMSRLYNYRQCSEHGKGCRPQQVDQATVLWAQAAPCNW